jgi:hypothetical protein
MKKTSRAKVRKVAYRLIGRDTDEGKPMYALLDTLVDAYHTHLQQARIGLAWCNSWAPDVDGRVTLGKCKKASDLDRELAAFDFVILLSSRFWKDAFTPDQSRQALLDHELTHAEVTLDQHGEPVEDERGRIVYRIRKHDLEEFSAIVERHGCWKRDLEIFAAAMNRAQSRPKTWPAYTRVQEALGHVGIDVPLDHIAAWSENERREAELWAAVQRELTARGLGSATTVTAVMPPHVEAVAALLSGAHA